MRIEEAVRKHLTVLGENGDEWTIRCLSPDHHDRNPSASVNVKKGLWVCYSCGEGGSIVDHLDGERITLEPETSDLLAELEREVKSLASPEVRTFSESWLRQFAVPCSYWTEDRGVPEALCEEFDLGYDWEWDTATYPVRDPAGRVLGVVRRRLRDGQLDPDGRPMPKYVYPRDVDVSTCLFGYEKLVGTQPANLVVTEGALDAIGFWQVGVPAVAQYGITLRDPQIALLKRLAPIRLLLAYDADDEGQKSLKRIFEGYRDAKRRWHPPLDLSFTFAQGLRWDPELGSDPWSLCPEVRERILEEVV